MRALGGSVVIAVALAGCSLLPSPPTAEIATSLSQRFDGRSSKYVVEPWPLDGSAAFLCLRAPGPEFTVAHPVVVDRDCVALEVNVEADRLTATFDPTHVPPFLADTFAHSSPPWFLAISGKRGSVSFARVLQTVDSPTPSDPGPS